MASYAGKAPWSQGYKAVRGSKARAAAAKAGYAWSLSGGWSSNVPDDWASNPKKPKTKQVRLPNGKTVNVIDDKLGDTVWHFPSTGAPVTDAEGKPTGTTDTGEYIAKAFGRVDEPEEGKGAKVYSKDIPDDGKGQNKAGGHIARIEYSMTYQLLRVTFRDGTVCVYFRVPAAVYGELEYLADGRTAMNVNGEERHVLGMRFWDLVRVRGTKHGARYKFEYTASGNYIPHPRSSENNKYRYYTDIKERGEGASVRPLHTRDKYGKKVRYKEEPVAFDPEYIEKTTRKRVEAYDVEQLNEAAKQGNIDLTPHKKTVKAMINGKEQNVNLYYMQNPGGQHVPLQDVDPTIKKVMAYNASRNARNIDLEDYFGGTDYPNHLNKLSSRNKRAYWTLIDAKNKYENGDYNAATAALQKAIDMNKGLGDLL